MKNQVWIIVLFGVLMGWGAPCPADTPNYDRFLYFDRLTLVPEEPVTVYAFLTVVEKDGRAVTNLTRDDFRLIEDGRTVTEPVTSRHFSGTERKLAYAFLFEHGAETSISLTLVREAADRFFSEIGFRHTGTVVSISGPPKVLAGPETDIHHLNAAIDEADPVEDPAHLADGILAGLDELQKSGEADGFDRKVIIVLTEGRDQGSRFSLRAAAEKVLESGVVLFIIHTGPEGSLSKALDQAARRSGGYVFETPPPEDLIPPLQAVANRLLKQYVLSYYSSGLTLDGKVHTLSAVYSENLAKKEFTMPVLDDLKSETSASPWLAALFLIVIIALAAFLVWKNRKTADPPGPAV